MIGEILNWLGAIAIVVGGLFGLLAGLGVLRLPDLYTRLEGRPRRSGFDFGRYCHRLGG
jgi:multisubunit Na+/H+ antiporter MnhG subunit